MSAFKWTDTTPKWVKPNPYRRHHGFDERTQTSISIEREQDSVGGWFWNARVWTETEPMRLQGGDLSEDEAKRVAPIQLAAQAKRLWEALS